MVLIDKVVGFSFAWILLFEQTLQEEEAQNKQLKIFIRRKRGWFIPHVL